MPKTKKHPYFLNVYRQIAIGFAVVAIILVGAIIFYSLVQARVEISPHKTLQSVEFLIGVGQNAYGDKVDGGLEERVIEGDEQVEATGTKNDVGKATGILTIINTTSSAQPLVATTRFLTPEGILFRLKNKATAPAKGKVDAEVYADKAGPSGNIGPSRFTIPGLLPAKQSLIYAESQKAMAGGDKFTRVVTAEDLARAKTMVLKKLEDEALQKYKEQLNDGNLEVVSKIVSGETSTAVKAGEEKLNFAVGGKIKLSLVYYNEAQLRELAKTQLLLTFPPDKEFVSFAGDKMIIKIENFDLTKNTATLRVYVDGEAVLRKTSQILNPEKIAGMSPEEAKKYLESFDAIDKAEIKMFPSWLRKIPTLKDHIEIVVKK
ncbi:MAG: hypothetical protein Q8M83_03545 [bacterium]|nr:hypothetical protein [bacterium]